AWVQVAAAQARRGDFKGAEFSLQRAVDLNPTRPGLTFLQGWVKENLGDEAGAIELYQHHLEVHGDDVGTRRRLVGLYARLGRFNEAYEEARRGGEGPAGQPPPPGGRAPSSREREVDPPAATRLPHP